METHIKETCNYLTLSTSTKNYKSILHFYVNELDMNSIIVLFDKRNVRGGY